MAKNTVPDNSLTNNTVLNGVVCVAVKPVWRLEAQISNNFFVSHTVFLRSENTVSDHHLECEKVNLVPTLKVPITQGKPV
jgi:hypothetical protein